MKKSLTVFLCLLITIAFVFSAFSVSVNAYADYVNSPNDDVKFTLLNTSQYSATGILTIYGTGEIKDLTSGQLNYYCSTINGVDIGPLAKTLYVEEGITRIGDYAFASYGDINNKKPKNLKVAYISNTVTSIGYYALNVDKLETVYIYGDNVTFDSYAITKNATIYGYAGTSVEQYAISNGNTFVALCRQHTEQLVNQKDPTCLESGYTGDVVCSVCGMVIEVGHSVDALGHNFELQNNVEPTCDSDGYSGDIICSRCGEVESEGEILPKLGHNWGSWQIVRNPTCKDEGIKIRFCDKCSAQETETIDKINIHTEGDWTVIKDATCTEDGLKKQVCSVCGEVIANEIIPALGHSYTDTVTDPTCTEQGYTTHTCTRCGDSYIDTYTAALGHTEGEWIVIKEPTYDEDGEKILKCSVCGETIKTEIIPKLVKSGWVQEGTNWLYYVDGVAQTSWQKINAKWYYFNANGIMQTGWQKLSGKWYYFGGANDGVLKTGWQKINSKWYYFGGADSGAMRTGWQKISGKWYYFGGADDGVMKTGWQKINNKWYYFGGAGDGVMKTGWQKISNKWYYFNADGDMKTGWLKSGGNWYYLDSNGVMLANTSKKIGSKTYKFNASGICTNP